MFLTFWTFKNFLIFWNFWENPLKIGLSHLKNDFSDPNNVIEDLTNGQNGWKVNGLRTDRRTDIVEYRVACKRQRMLSLQGDSPQLWKSNYIFLGNGAIHSWERWFLDVYFSWLKNYIEKHCWNEWWLLKPFWPIAADEKIVNSSNFSKIRSFVYL